MKCNPRNTQDVPSPTVDQLLVKGHIPSHRLLMSHLFTVDLELHLPVTVKPWKSTEKSQVFQEDCVPSQTDLNRPSPVEQKRHQIWDTRSCHPQLLPLPAPRCWSVHAGTLSRVRSRIILLSLCLRSLSLLCTPLSHSCHCLVTALSLPSCFSAPDVIFCLLLLLASHGKYTELLHVRNTLSKRRVFLLINGTKALALGGDKADSKLLQIFFRETQGLTSSPCQWWNNRLK